MTEELKFGPEWLRALSDSNTVSSSSASSYKKYKMAEHRYSHEEMLSLFNDCSDPPDCLSKHSRFYVDKIQSPVTTQPLSEEEQRIMGQGVNSVNAVRKTGHGPMTNMRGRNPGGRPESGRGRGRGVLESYGPGVINEEGDGYNSHGMRRDNWDDGRRFDRSRSLIDDHPPFRKEYVRPTSDNWRSKDDAHGKPEEDPGEWRRVGIRKDWNARGNWRDHPVSDYDPSRVKGPGAFPQSNRYPPRVPRSKSECYEEDQLPEWSVADSGDVVGSFDANGQFVSSNNQDATDALIEDVEIWDEEEESSSSLNSSSTKEPIAISQDSSPQPNENTFSRTSTSDGNIGASPPDSCPPRQTDDSTVTQSSNDVSNDRKILHDHTGIVTDSDSNVDSSDKHAKTVDPLSQLEIQAESMVATVVDDVEDHNVSNQNSPPNTFDPAAVTWFYQDPQGNIQGPFPSSDMADWFTAGYFDMNLQLKRNCDNQFRSLGELAASCGGKIPFLSEKHLQPMIPVEPAVSATVDHSHLIQQQYLMHCVFQQQFMLRQLHLQNLAQLQQQQQQQHQQQQQQPQSLPSHLVTNVSQPQISAPNERFVTPLPPSSLTGSVPQSDIIHQFVSQMQPMPNDAGQMPPISMLSGPFSVNSLSSLPINSPLEYVSESEVPRVDLSKHQPQTNSNNQPITSECQEPLSIKSGPDHSLRPTECPEIVSQNVASHNTCHEKLDHTNLSTTNVSSMQLHENREEKISNKNDLERFLQKNDQINFQDLQKIEQSQMNAAKTHKDSKKDVVKKKDGPPKPSTENKKTLNSDQKDQKQSAAESSKKKSNQTPLSDNKPDLSKQTVNNKNVTKIEKKKPWNEPMDKQPNKDLSLIQIQEREQDEEMHLLKQKAVPIDRDRRVTHGQAKGPKQAKSWNNSVNVLPQPKSLLEIQQEEESQQQKERQLIAEKGEKTLASAVISGGNAGISATWATEGTWGKTGLRGSNSNTQPADKYDFPTLSSQNQAQKNQSKSKQSHDNSKVSKQQTALQKLFNMTTSSNEFMQWCEKKLRGQETSVDIPTFVTFLQEVESPKEVQEYICLYLGKTEFSKNFGEQFLQMRKQYKEKLRENHAKKDNISSAINKNMVASPSRVSKSDTALMSADDSQKKKTKKKKMQKIDSSILGFTVQASQERVNVGEIDNSYN